MGVCGISSDISIKLGPIDIQEVHMVLSFGSFDWVQVEMPPGHFSIMPGA